MASEYHDGQASGAAPHWFGISCLRWYQYPSQECDSNAWAQHQFGAHHTVNAVANANISAYDTSTDKPAGGHARCAGGANSRTPARAADHA
jgi:hypothetical protein